MLDLKFPNSYYVGFQKSRYDNDEQQGRILGFATPIGTDKAYEKRKETVDRWSDKNVPSIEFKNEPCSGFKIVDTAVRHYTDNKVFRVMDPRGFELEIDVYNLMRIINEHTIVNGMIVDSMLWARKGSTNYLISSSSPEYKQYLSGDFSKTEHIPGKFYKNKVGNILYRFEGKFHFASINVSTNTQYETKNGYWSREAKETRLDIEVDNKFKEKMIVYTEFKLKDGNIDENVKPILHFKKSYIKDLLNCEEEYKHHLTFPINKYISAYYNTEMNDFDVSIHNYHNKIIICFENLEQAKQHTIDIDDIEEKVNILNYFKKDLYYSRCYGTVYYNKNITYKK